MSTTSIERFRLTSIILNLVFIPLTVILLWLLLKKPAFDCDSCFDKKQIVTHDTIYPKDILKPIIVKAPEAFKAVAKAKFINQTGGTAVGKLLRSEVDKNADSAQACQSASASPCDSIRFYSDTCYAQNSYRAVVNDTVEGRILGRSVWFVNLTPEVTTTIEKRLRERWKFYIGGSVTINQRNMDRWGAGPSVLLTIPKIGGISYYFDAKNFAHTGSFYALIRLKK